mgnify:CR=1 FL=1
MFLQLVAEPSGLGNHRPIGTADIAGLVRESSEEDYLMHCMYQQQESEKLLNDEAAASGKHKIKFVCILDLEGLSWARCARSIPYFNRMVKMLDSNFPERLHVCVVCRAPWSVVCDEARSSVLL